jgi:HEPN domain-containing protein
MKYQFEQCLKRGKIVRISIDEELIRKELRGAEEDLNSAKHSLAERDMKWAIIQGYYAQFHSIRALVFAKGYREKSHACLRYALEALYIDEIATIMKKIGSSLPGEGRIDEPDTNCRGYPPPHPHVRCRAAAPENTARLFALDPG